MGHRAGGGALLVVAAALIHGDGRVLMQRRPPGKHHGGLWEFPGGKVEAGEAPDRALVRELGEELGIVVDPADATPLSFAGEPPLLLLLYRVGRWIGEPRAVEPGAALDWHARVALADLPMPPADAALSRACFSGGGGTLGPTIARQ